MALSPTSSAMSTVQYTISTRYPNGSPASASLMALTPDLEKHYFQNRMQFDPVGLRYTVLPVHLVKETDASDGCGSRRNLSFESWHHGFLALGRGLKRFRKVETGSRCDRIREGVSRYQHPFG